MSPDLTNYRDLMADEAAPLAPKPPPAPRPRKSKAATRRARAAQPAPEPETARAALDELWAAADVDDYLHTRPRQRHGRPATFRLPRYLDDALDAYTAGHRLRTRTNLMTALLDAYLRDKGLLDDQDVNTD